MGMMGRSEEGRPLRYDLGWNWRDNGVDMSLISLRLRGYTKLARHYGWISLQSQKVSVLVGHGGKLGSGLLAGTVGGRVVGGGGAW